MDGVSPHLEQPALAPLPRVGPRVVLRRLAHTDLPAFQAYRSNEAVGLYQGWSTQTDQEALAFIEGMSNAMLFPSGEWVQLAVTDRGTNTLIGDIGVCVAADGTGMELCEGCSQEQPSPQPLQQPANNLKGPQEVQEVLLLGGRQRVVVGNHGVGFGRAVSTVAGTAMSANRFNEVVCATVM
jgi:hypothetical protein